MKIELYPKNMLERLWKKDKKWFSDGIGQKPVCLRCGNPLDEQLMVNSLSRHAKIYVCQQCGTDEAMRDYAKIVMPFESWYGVTSKRALLQSAPSWIFFQVQMLQVRVKAEGRTVRLPIHDLIMTVTDGGPPGFTVNRSRHLRT